MLGLQSNLDGIERTYMSLGLLPPESAVFERFA